MTARQDTGYLCLPGAARPGATLLDVVKLTVFVLIIVGAGTYASIRVLAVRHTNRGTEHYSQGAFDEAIGAYERALKIHPGFKPARDNLRDVCIDKADRLAMSTDHAEAELLYRRAIELGSDANDIHWKLAMTCWHLGERSEALAEVEEHLRGQPTDQKAVDFARNLRGSL